MIYICKTIKRQIIFLSNYLYMIKSDQPSCFSLGLRVPRTEKPLSLGQIGMVGHPRMIRMTFINLLYITKDYCRPHNETCLSSSMLIRLL